MNNYDILTLHKHEYYTLVVDTRPQLQRKCLAKCLWNDEVKVK